MMARTKKFIKDLTNGQKVALIAAFIGGICVVIAACIGLTLPIVERAVDETIDQQQGTIPRPDGAVELPSGQSEIISFVVDSGVRWALWRGLIVEELDRSVPRQTIDLEDVIQKGSISPQFAVLNEPSTVAILITGMPLDEPIQISNRIPIRMEDYKPLPEEVDVINMEIGGGEDYWFLGADLSRQVLSMPDKIAWASYTPDLEIQLKLAERNCPDCLSEYPDEIKNILLGGVESSPDYFMLQDKERIAFGIALFFRDPGIYTFSLGVEYVYGSFKGIVWADPPLQVYVPKNYFVWDCGQSGNLERPECTITESCRLNSDGRYSCTKP
jgi:hypothetical protein